MLSFLIIFMLHNLEEIIMIERWFQKTYPRINTRILSYIQKELKHYKNTTSIQFAVVIFVFAVFVSALLFVAAMTQHDYLFLGVNLFFGLNIFTHPLQTLYLRSYTPGVLTSLFLIIPYYSLFFYRYYSTNMFTLDSILGALIVFVFLIPVFLLSHKIGEKWSTFFSLFSQL